MVIIFRIKRKMFPQGWMNNTTLSIQRDISRDICTKMLAIFLAINSAIFLAYRRSSCAIYLSVQRSEYLVRSQSRRSRRWSRFHREHTGRWFCNGCNSLSEPNVSKETVSYTRARKSFQPKLFQSSSRKRCVNLRVVKSLLPEGNNVNEKRSLILDLINYEIIKIINIWWWK